MQNQTSVLGYSMCVGLQYGVARARTINIPRTRSNVIARARGMANK